MPKGYRQKSPEPGTTIGMWSYVKDGPTAPQRMWVVRCLYCGSEVLRQARYLAAGRAVYHRPCPERLSIVRADVNGHHSPAIKRYRYNHIISDDVLRRRWMNCKYSMIKRCYSPNETGFHNYGGRGITVSEEFHNMESFLRYVVTLDGWDNRALQLDRINNNGNYERGNLRMATRSEQRLNQRPEFRAMVV